MLTALSMLAIAAQADYFSVRPDDRKPDFAGAKSGNDLAPSRAENYRQLLGVAEEPSLYQRSLRVGDAIRLTWLPTFHPAVTVRVEALSSPRPRLIARRLEGRAGFATSAVAGRVNRPLTPGEATALRALLVAGNPFIQQEAPDTGVRMSDGSGWLIEGVSGGVYHVIERSNPDVGPVHATGMAMLRLTGWKFANIY
ncbi:hypothetical protein [Sphingomonas sp. Leaf10]|uniref:hypothetical protein n=1 Tax=Sphingomonas sp. Leaf10 TaxID=1735676 RepID=UPI0006F1E2E9|nr:hypothetical protein [Sphingomonas sp. Leaf10]KQM36128.1 hypothetical protein ASE59_15850 [Sphingomonas sp. Leaf10]